MYKCKGKMCTNINVLLTVLEPKCHFCFKTMKLLLATA